ncbi:MAG: peptidoglycan DD-metalloendopeptidase family protein [Clostridia bacterium]|nr:peptidoglycan DD-metalloendopeptidase family protein [Clostridia bacterium]
MKKPLFSLRIAAVLLALVMLVTGNAVWSATAATKSELEQKLELLERQETQIKQQLASAKNDLSASQQRKNLIDSQIANVQQQIDLLDTQVQNMNAQITAVESQITAAEKEIADKEAAIAQTRENLGTRLRAIAKTGNMTTLQLLFSVDNYKDYLIKAKAMQLIADNDQAAIEAYEAQVASIATQQADLENKKVDLEEQKQQLETVRASSNAKKKQLDTLYAAAQAEVKKLQSTVSGYNSQLAAKQREMEETEKEITKLIQNTTSTGQYNNSMMYWPVPTVRAISSTFGVRWGTMHRGIDIANGPIPIYGQNIVAAADGTVIYANYTSVWGGGYGYYCIIDHGKDSRGRSVTTLYAHCSKMYARVGQKVVGGKTVIAQAGSTGNVTGPHLHFEVRLDAKSVDPLGTYVSPNVN